MRVIFLTNNYLDTISGGSFASIAFVNAFSEIAEQCILLYPDRGTQILPFINKSCVKIGVYNQSSNFKKLIDIYSGKIHRYSGVLIPEIKKFQPDLVVFDSSRSSAGLIKKVKALGVKIITIHHNYEMEYYRGTPPPILYRTILLHYIKKAEKNSIIESNLNLTLTNEDINLLRIHYDPLAKFRFERLGCFEGISKANSIIKEISQDQLKFVITGSLSSLQTEVSLIPFLKEYYPIILNLFPQSKLIIAGKNPSNKIIEECQKYPKIDLIADPIDMDIIVSGANIYICPTSVGGGMKLRVMDGLRAGLPVLTNIVSERGYSKFKETEILFSYSDTKSFEINLNRLMKRYFSGQLSKSFVLEMYRSELSFSSGVSRLKYFLSKHCILN